MLAPGSIVVSFNAVFVAWVILMSPFAAKCRSGSDSKLIRGIWVRSVSRRMAADNQRITVAAGMAMKPVKSA